MTKKLKLLSAAVLTAIALFTAGIEYFSPKTAENTVSAPANTDGTLTADFIDVGQGDCTLVTVPNGKTMLIDSGESYFSDTVLDFLDSKNIETLDVVIGTHPHTDHIGGLAEIIGNIETESIYLPNAVSGSKTYENLLLTIESSGRKITQAKEGVKIELDESVDIEILSPKEKEYSNLNNYSAIVRIVYGDTSFLFTGDAESEIEYELLMSGHDISADVLKVPHHGADTSSSSSFITAVNPKIAVIPVGNGNQYGHPSPLVLKRIERTGTEIYRTDTDGNIRIISDGENVRRVTDGNQQSN